MKRVIDRFLIGRRKLTDILHRFPFLSTVAFASSSPRDLTISRQTNCKRAQANSYWPPIKVLTGFVFRQCGSRENHTKAFPAYGRPSACCFISVLKVYRHRNGDSLFISSASEAAPSGELARALICCLYAVTL